MNDNIKNKGSFSGKALARSAVLMGVIILASKVLGLLRDILVASAYGTTDAAIAYATASKLPVTIFDFILGGVVTSAFIPVYNSIAVRKGKNEALSFAQSYLNLILTITTALTVAGVLFAPTLVGWIAPDLSTEAARMATELTRIMFPMVIFVGMAFSFVGFLQSEGEYNIPALISLVSNLIMVGYLFTLNGRFGVKGLAVAMLVGWIAQAAVQIPALIKRGYRYKLTAPLATPEIGRAAKNTLPILIATWTTPVCNLINTNLASGIEGGRAISALDYANRLYIIIVGLFSFVATNLLFPYFAKAAASGDTDESDRLTRTSIRTLIFIIAPISVGVAVLSGGFVSIIYENGVFNSADTAITAEALRAYSVGMIFAAVCEVLTKAFFAVEKTKIPMLSSIISMTFNIAVVVIFGEYLGIGGIALVSVGATAVNMAINLIFAVNKKLITPTSRDARGIAKSLISAAVMGCAVWYVSTLTEGMGKLFGFIIPVLVGVTVYAVAAALLGCDEMKAILGIFKKKGKAER
ncbi:MAG: murein biosynthesis integral membrane protein MurJ [Clostridia bacterium]|nr:murein biosynthesis integral membrane protein MurJ [Clostridia bacterium]